MFWFWWSVVWMLVVRCRRFGILDVCGLFWWECCWVCWGCCIFGYWWLGVCFGVLVIWWWIGSCGCEGCIWLFGWLGCVFCISVLLYVVMGLDWYVGIVVFGGIWWIDGGSGIICVGCLGWWWIIVCFVGVWVCLGCCDVWLVYCIVLYWIYRVLRFGWGIVVGWWVGWLVCFLLGSWWCFVWFWRVCGGNFFGWYCDWGLGLLGVMLWFSFWCVWIVVLVCVCLVLVFWGWGEMYCFFCVKVVGFLCLGRRFRVWGLVCWLGSVGGSGLRLLFVCDWVGFWLGSEFYVVRWCGGCGGNCWEIGIRSFLGDVGWWGRYLGYFLVVLWCWCWVDWWYCCWMLGLFVGCLLVGIGLDVVVCCWFCCRIIMLLLCFVLVGVGVIGRGWCFCWSWLVCWVLLCVVCGFCIGGWLVFGGVVVVVFWCLVGIVWFVIVEWCWWEYCCDGLWLE